MVLDIGPLFADERAAWRVVDESVGAAIAEQGGFVVCGFPGAEHIDALGLQAAGPDGTWRDVPMLDGTVSVHLGTVLHLMTGGRIPATPHRVIDHGGARQSIGFFVEPGLATRLAPLDAPVDDVHASYGWHLQERFHSMRGYAELVPSPVLAADSSTSSHESLS